MTLLPRLAAALVATVCALGALPASAQQVVTLATGFRSVAGVAVDGSGNVYVSDTTESLVEEIPGAAPGDITPIGTGLGQPYGIAVDGQDNIFVADTTNNVVHEFLASDGYVVVQKIGSGFSQPNSVAVDARGNVFVADATGVTEVTAASGFTATSKIGSGITSPHGIALDGSGNVFVTDGAGVQEILAAGNYVTVQTLGSGFHSPTGVALDSSGNVFVADTGSSTVKEIHAAGGYVNVTTLLTDISGPVTLAIDSSGNIFSADDQTDVVAEFPAADGYKQAIQIEAGFVSPTGIAIDASGNFFVADVGTDSIKVLLASAGFTQGYDLLTGVGFPKSLAATPNGDVFVSTGAAILVIPAAGGHAVAVPFATGTIQAIAVDRSGNLFVAAGGEIVEVLAAGGYVTQQVIGGSNSIVASYLATDGADNLFLLDIGGTSLSELTASSGYNTMVSWGNSYSQSVGLAIDGNGDIYIPDIYGRILELIPGSTAYAYVDAPFTRIAGIAADSRGNLFVADAGTERLVEIPASALVAAVLPSSRSVLSSSAATFFATMINAGPTTLDNCRIALDPNETPPGVELSFQATDPVTNIPVGTPNRAVTIAGGNSAQSFMLSLNLNPASATAPLALQYFSFYFVCNGTSPAAVIPGVNTIDLTLSKSPGADVIALAATPTSNGIVEGPIGGAAAFGVASINLGATETLTVSVDTGLATLPVAVNICQTEAGTGQCLATPAPSLQLNYAGGAAPTFSVFVQPTGAIPLAPGSSRVYVRFKDASGGIHGSTSVALETL